MHPFASFWMNEYYRLLVLEFVILMWLYKRWTMVDGFEGWIYMEYGHGLCRCSCCCDEYQLRYGDKLWWYYEIFCTISNFTLLLPYPNCIISIFFKIHHRVAVLCMIWSVGLAGIYHIGGCLAHSLALILKPWYSIVSSFISCNISMLHRHAFMFTTRIK